MLLWREEPPLPIVSCFSSLRLHVQMGSVKSNLRKHPSLVSEEVLPPRNNVAQLGREAARPCVSKHRGAVELLRYPLSSHGDRGWWWQSWQRGREPMTWEVNNRNAGIRFRLARESSVPISPSM